jgi:signal transduction histidine kinase
VRRRLVRSIVAVAAAAVALFALPLAFAVHNAYQDEELLRLQRDTVAATRAIDIPTHPGDAIELPGGKDTLAVYNAKGVRIAGKGPTAADRLVRDALRGERPTDAGTGNRLIAAVPLLANERVVGALRAERGDDAVESASRHAWLVLAAIALLLITLAGLVARLLATRLASPLEQLALAASRLGSGDFSARAPSSGVQEADEIAHALDATAKRLDDLVSRERAFSSDASHQLRTPLAALRIEIESMELEGNDAPQLKRALEQLNRVESTIETLLAVARDAPRTATHFNLVDLLDTTAERWRDTLASQGRPLRVRTDKRRHDAAASAEVVREILDVLLDNALRYGAGEVELRVHERDAWLVTEVQDHGQGFASGPDDPFERRDPGAGGHGIGLALARSLAHAEGGSLSIVDAGPHPVVALVLRSAEADRRRGARRP